jgi:hypothetical protein
LTRAVSELNETVKLNHENVLVYYYLEKAIISMIEHKTLTKAKDAFKISLAKGVPLGHKEDVRNIRHSQMDYCMK